MISSLIKLPLLIPDNMAQTKSYFFTIFINFLASFPSIITTGLAIFVVAAFNWKKSECKINIRVANYMYVGLYTMELTHPSASWRVFTEGYTFKPGIEGGGGGVGENTQFKFGYGYASTQSTLIS